MATPLGFGALGPSLSTARPLRVGGRFRISPFDFRIGREGALLLAPCSRRFGNQEPEENPELLRYTPLFAEEACTKLNERLQPVW